jgi:hypothetical protein
LTKPGPVGLSASVFAGSTLVTGAILSWVTSYLLAPTEAKWLETPEIPFQLGLVFAVLLTVIGGLLFAAVAAAVAWARAHQPPSHLVIRAALAGLIYTGALLGGAEYSGRMLVWHLPVTLFWTLVFALPPLFGVAVWQGRNAAAPN